MVRNEKTLIKLARKVAEIIIDVTKRVPKSLCFWKSEQIRSKFLEEIPSLRAKIKQDLAFFLESDPAIDSIEEVIACYPGFKAIVTYRIAHILSDISLKFEARMISEYIHKETGIDIHPGAEIGVPFFIDHGTGIVIGETSIIGDRVKIYQGVTIGALSLADGALLKGKKRHPTIGNDVTIYSGASILGGETNIGNNVVIGSNVFLLQSVPNDCKVLLQKPELRFVKK